MKYLDPTFSVGPAAKQMDGTCERCVYRTGEHAPGCELQKARAKARELLFGTRKPNNHVYGCHCDDCNPIVGFVHPFSVQTEFAIDIEQAKRWLEGSWDIREDPAMPNDTIYFISPRKQHIVIDTEGRECTVYDESEAEWAKRCGVIRNVGDPK